MTGVDSTPEIMDDHHLLYVNQRQSRLEVTSNGTTFHKGLIFPGMMRLASPGEKVHGRPLRRQVWSNPGTKRSSQVKRRLVRPCSW